MESANDLITAAERLGQNKAQNSPVGMLSTLLNGAFSGYTAGRQMAQQEKAAALERTIKLLDAQKKVSDIQTEGQNRTIAGNLAKRLGLMDLDPNESSTAKGVAFDALGGGAPPPPDNTSSGKLSKIYTSLNTPYSVIKPKFSAKEGLGFDFEMDPSKKPPADPAADQQKIRAAAEEAARREKYNTIASIVGPDEAQKYAGVQATEDEIQKYLPEMTTFFKGDTAGTAKLKAAREKSNQPNVDALTNLQSMIEEERGKSNLNPKNWFGPNQTDVVDNLTTGRNALLNGKGFNDIAAGLDKKIADVQAQAADSPHSAKKAASTLIPEISVYLKTLASNPTANRSAIKKFTQQKIQLMSLGGSQ